MSKRPLLLLLVVAPLAACAAGVFDQFRRETARSWPTVEATVSESTALRGCDRNGNFTPRVRYAYSIAGKDFVGDRIAFGYGLCDSKDVISTITNTFPIGKKISVHVDPHHPDESVIDIDRFAGGTSTTLILGTVSGIAAIVVYFLWNHPRFSES